MIVLTIESAFDADKKAKDDNPTIGLLLCKVHNRSVAEYALQGMDKPMASQNLPTIEAIEKELQCMQAKDASN